MEIMIPGTVVVAVLLIVFIVGTYTGAFLKQIDLDIKESIDGEIIPERDRQHGKQSDHL